MDTFTHTLIPLSQNGYKIKIAMIGANSDDRKTLEQYLIDEIGEEKINFMFDNDPEKFRMRDENIRIFEMPEFNKKKMRNFFGRFNVNFVFDYRKNLVADNIIHPMYIGLFPNLLKMSEIIRDEKLLEFYTQETPLHVTVEYLGSKTSASLEYPFGKIIDLEISGYSQNKAGVCLVVKPVDELSGDHITLGTNKDFSPADVGKMIEPNNIKKFEKTYLVKSVLSPMF